MFALRLTPLLALCVTRASAGPSAAQCLSNYEKAPATCDSVAALAFCIADAAVDMETADARAFEDILASKQRKMAGKCNLAREIRTPTIQTDAGNLVLNSGEKDLLMHRYRKEVVSLWDISEKVGGMSATVAKAVSDIEKTSSAMKKDVDTKLSEQAKSMDAKLGAQASKMQDLVDSACAWPYEFVANKKCTKLAVCKAGQYEKVAPSKTSDRTCSTWSTCKAAAEYEDLAPSRYQDRTCKKLTACDAKKQFVLRQATTKTDRACKTLTVCNTKQWESSGPTLLRDRACNAITECKSPQIEVTKPTKTADRVCGIPSYASCKAALAAGVKKNGFVQMKVGGSSTKVYCLQEKYGGGWTLAMRVSKRDGKTNFYHNGASWSAKSYGDINKLNLKTQNYNDDYISPIYAQFSAKNILVTESVTATNRLVYTTNNCMSGRNLHQILSPGSKSCNGYACCNAVYGSGTPRHGSYNNLVLGGDECSDTEPAKIALRAGCGGDSETLQLGYYRNGHGNNEVFSQGNHWGNLQGTYVFVRE